MSNIGKKIYGFCNGFFGRDDYDNKKIESEGVDWIVARETNNSTDDYPRFACFNNEEEKNKYIKKWSKKEIL